MFEICIIILIGFSKTVQSPNENKSETLRGPKVIIFFFPLRETETSKLNFIKLIRNRMVYITRIDRWFALILPMELQTKLLDKKVIN